MKRLFALLLALVLTLPLVACGLSGGGEQTDEGGSQTETAPTETSAPASPVNIIADGVTEYVIIRPDNADEQVINAATTLRTELINATDANVGIDTDWYKKGDALPESAKEIVVGVCDRPATESILKNLRENDFAIVYENERIYILSAAPEATLRGVEYFIENYLNVSTKSLVILDDLNYINRFKYPLGIVSINGVGISEYRIVIPDDCGFYTSSAAANLSDYFYYYGGISLDIVTDAESPEQYEILVGNTNRPESQAAASVALGADQYILAETGSCVVMTGNSYMVGGGVSDFINNYAAPRGDSSDINITNLPKKNEPLTFAFKEARNALLLIGDGMGHNHVEATLAAGLREFVAKDLPNIGTAVTRSANKAITDSAASATALATGYKTNNKYLGVGTRGERLTNLRELAFSQGARTAILTTDVITGATPGGFLAHVPDRGSTAMIKSQIDKLLADGEVDFAVGDIGDGLTREAARQLWAISYDGSRFFSMIEAAWIDKYAHKNLMEDVVKTVTRYNDLIAYCVIFTICHPDTAIVITADHECGGLVFNKAKNEYTFTSLDHTAADVPVYSIGQGTEYFSGKKVDNTDIAKFIAKIFGDDNFGG